MAAGDRPAGMAHRLVNAHDGRCLTPLTGSVATYERVPGLSWQKWELTAVS